MPGLEGDNCSSSSSASRGSSSSGWGFEKRKGGKRGTKGGGGGGATEEDRSRASSGGGGVRTVLVAALVKLSLRTRAPPSPALVSLLRRASVAGSLDLASAASEALALLDDGPSMASPDGVAALRAALSMLGKNRS